LAPSLPECPLHWRCGWHSFWAWCLTTQLGACLHTKPCVPLASTELPHRQEWWLPSSEPSLMRTASSSSHYYYYYSVWWVGFLCDWCITVVRYRRIVLLHSEWC